ncbi:MAG: restriction endonuclease [Desulfobacterium sp.]|nr:restriction endonuclease [Desulfobacteraceae bacterium]MBA3035697.1 restriction endonuclease [Desulfobacterium sp.]MBU3948073.1 restriction endonuclease [Pseudomonadota bacterium]MBU4010521.1 restriction endonuclease [Pseudomonadota bacterium]MBU4034898.1 restriction endonuclease [Pseudomonadota bacterium]
MKSNSQMPKYHELMNPLLKALQELGGSGSIEEIAQKVSELSGLPEEVLNIPHNPEKSSQTEIEYRLAWARTYLKKYGLLENSDRGIWLIVPEKHNVKSVDPQVVIKTVRDEHKRQKETPEKEKVSEEEKDIEIPDEAETWRSTLHQTLINEISPDAFERLAKRILRESGFVQVEVTGRSGDGGIDGKGIMRLSGLLSFHVIFQCKKYKGAVTASDIRDFRGAMIGRADKGLFITTGTFTRDAIREATRDGAPPIDLVDGDQLADKLKELGLGIKKEMVEKISIDIEWFKSI